MDNYASPPRPEPALELTLACPPELITLIADAVSERLNGDPSPSRSPWFDVPGAAAYLEMSPGAVRKAASRGLLPAHQPFGPGSRYFFHRHELDEYILGSTQVLESTPGSAR